MLFKQQNCIIIVLKCWQIIEAGNCEGTEQLRSRYVMGNVYLKVTMPVKGRSMSRVRRNYDVYSSSV